MDEKLRKKKIGFMWFPMTNIHVLVLSKRGTLVEKLIAKQIAQAIARKKNKK
jgi:hypothetical protein